MLNEDPLAFGVSPVYDRPGNMFHWANPFALGRRIESAIRD